jgi:hypothetical protein
MGWWRDLQTEKAGVKIRVKKGAQMRMARAQQKKKSAKQGG